MARPLKEAVTSARDDEFVADYSEAREGGFAAIPEDDYNATVTDIEAGTSKAGNPKVRFTFTLADGEYKGRTFFRHCPLVGKGSGILRDTLKAFGIESTRFKRADVLNQRCVVTIATQKGEDITDDERRQEVKKVKPASKARVSSGGAGAKPPRSKATASATPPERPGSSKASSARKARLA